MSRVLVTGGTGFLGHHLVAALIAEGHQVRVLTRDQKRARKILPASADCVEGDIVSSDACRRAIAGCDTVFHLAAAFQEPEISRRRYYDVHVLGTQRLIDAARAVDARRFVHCSTVGVLGHIDSTPADETWPHNPGDVYQDTKSQAEKLVLRMQQQYSLPITVARPTPIYGPGDMRLLKLYRMIASGRFVMVGSGNVFYHLIYVQDMVRGLLLLAEHPDAIGEVFIFGGLECVTLNELVTMIADEIGVEPPRRHMWAWPIQCLGSLVESLYAPLHIRPPLYRRRVDFFTKNRAFSVEKARRELGFEATTNLQTGIRETVRWYRQHGYLPARSSPE